MYGWKEWVLWIKLQNEVCEFYQTISKVTIPRFSDSFIDKKEN